jgi:GT2 family glycosyltransferase
MPKRRTRSGAPHPDDDSWRPIRLVRVDVETHGLADDKDGGTIGESGDRVWIEAVRSGHVVGLVEARLDRGRLTQELLDEVSSAVEGEADDPCSVPDAQLAFASIVVPTLWRRPEQLEAAIASLDAMDYPDFEIVVVDNRTGVTIDAPSFPDRPRVRVLSESVAGISSARNRGVAATSGEFVAFTDDDAVVDVGWLRALGSRFVREPEVEAIGGLVLPSELDTEAQLWFEQYYGGFSQSFRRSTVSLWHMQDDPLFPYAPGRFGAGCNMAFRRSTLDALGGFDATLGTGTPSKGGEDLAIFIRLITNGGTMGFEPTALVRHSHRRTKAEFLTQVRDYGTGLTAMYTSLVLHSPRTLLELLGRVPAGFRLLLRRGSGRAPSKAPTFPRRAFAWQLVGMGIGPLAFAHSWARTRRASRRRT